MRHHNSVFHAILKHVPWHVFDRLVSEHGADARVRRLSTQDQLIALLYGQLSGAQSLREIEGGLASHRNRLYHLGAEAVSRSTLADANSKRPAAVFAGLFAELVQRVGRGLRRDVGEAVYLVDSTSVRLSKLSADWAKFSEGVFSAKLHIVYDANGEHPTDAIVTPAKVNDITVAKTLQIEAGATYVYDLGYYSYDWWAQLDHAGCRIVTRLKSNTKLSDVTENPVEDDAILSDCIGHLPSRLAASRENPFKSPVREIRVRIESGTILRIVSNDLDAPATEIAALYKRRWQVELFFRWMKQTMKIKHFLGTSENAVRIQIAVALIAFLLLRLAHATQNVVDSLLAFTRLIRANLMHRRSIDALLKPPPTIKDQRQLSLSIDQI
ncbi:IS4 family transposase [Rhodopseudomonas palustris]|uniref:IS4 family transposase n=1 Tax=Rhodopseudomonas palustris TaxID=1076 RepID=A0A418UX15_RHOPL|nr:IS4 family transposase [Rhodopseudomonas palustris]RJF63379.1 IS4 family transposase [Rhodopseudomonas palustris]